MYGQKNNKCLKIIVIYLLLFHFSELGFYYLDHNSILCLGKLISCSCG